MDVYKVNVIESYIKHSMNNDTENTNPRVYKHLGKFKTQIC